MAVTVQLKYLRHSARKLRALIGAYRGQNLEQAIHQTAVAPQDSARFLHQALKSARSVAQTKEFDPATLQISQVFATEGPKIKRIRPNARGRTNRYQKHLAHLTVIVDEAQKVEKPVKKVAKKR